MIALSQAVVVEGRYDKIKLDSLLDAIVVTTEGFQIFEDTEKQALLRRLAEECGLVVLTDSDDAGFRIRKFISDICVKGRVYHAYIPDVAGKERRKARPGAAGLLGVEGVPQDVIERALRECLQEGGIAQDSCAPPARRITAADLYEAGLSGRAGAAGRRAALLTAAGLPTRLSTNAVLQLLNRLVGYDGFWALVESLENETLPQ